VGLTDQDVGRTGQKSVIPWGEQAKLLVRLY
jgi:hypothetical protein